MKRRASVWRLPGLALFLALGSTILVNAQTRKNAASKSDDYFNLFEVGVFGGVEHYGDVNAGTGFRLTTGGLLGVRLTENPFEHFGFEQSFSGSGWHGLQFLQPVRGVNLPHFEPRVYEGELNALAYFTDRSSHVRPFLTIGAGPTGFSVPKGDRRLAQSLDPSLGIGSLKSDTRMQVNYGAGVKWQVHPRVGVRADVRGLVGPTPNFGLSSLPAAGTFISTEHSHWMQGVQATVGIGFYFGRKEAPAPPPPPPPPPVPPTIPPHNLNAGTISASSTSVCPGDPVQLSSNASDPNGHTLNYQWSVDGTRTGPNSSNFTFTPNRSGDVRIGVHVTDMASQAPANAADAAPVTIHVREYSAPVMNGVSANPTELERGQTANLSASARGSECGGTLTYSWASSEGSVTGTGPNAQFNSSSVSFNENDRSRPQSKQVRITANVRDSKGGSASGSTSVTVNLRAEAKHFGDIVFPKGSARVNNCGKRILIEQLYPILTANSNYDVVLVGHIDTAEVPKGKSAKGRSLDRDRVLQTAGVLSGGTGTCAALDRSRIRGSWVGATQETESLPTSCAVSTTPPKERKGAEITDASEAKNRRVEIWLVPKGMPLPPAARDAKDLPEADMKKIGCPK